MLDGGKTEALLPRNGSTLPRRPAFQATWLLEALLPGFKWLSLGSFVLGVIESALYGAWAGFLYSALFNYFAASRSSGRASRDGGAGSVRMLMVTRSTGKEEHSMK